MARTKKKRPEKGLVHDRIVELETAIAGVRDGRKTNPRTARLLAAGLPRIAQKLAEEATEVVIDLPPEKWTPGYPYFASACSGVM